MAKVLDSNIVIYCCNKDQKALQFLRRYKNESLFISIISWIEVLSGSEKHSKHFGEVLNMVEQLVEVLPLDKEIGKLALPLIQEAKKRGQKVKLYHDIIIAATALHQNAELITNNPKDFQWMKGLKVIPLE